MKPTFVFANIEDTVIVSISTYLSELDISNNLYFTMRSEMTDLILFMRGDNINDCSENRNYEHRLMQI